jgi:hypothetical protein
MSAAANLLGLLQGLFSTPLGNADAKTAIEELGCNVFRWKKAAADAMAADTTAETLGFSIPFAGYVKKITVVTDADVTGHASNHATITVNKRDAAGANSVAVGTYTTDSDNAAQGSLAEFVDKDFTLSTTAGARSVVAGGCMNVAIAKGGSGVVLPILEIAVHIIPE